MSEPQKIVHSPYTAQELLESGWILRVRKAILADGNAVAIGSENTIDAQCINRPEAWMPVMLPNGGTKLASHEDCVQVMMWLEGHDKIPEPPK